MTVRDAIEKSGLLYGDVEYRTKITIDGEEKEVWGGTCYYNGEKLIPYDYDYFSLDDEIYGYEMFFDIRGRKVLTVWYRSMWVSGQ